MCRGRLFCAVLRLLNVCEEAVFVERIIYPCMVNEPLNDSNESHDLIPTDFNYVVLYGDSDTDI